ncbi:hypothetical protein NXW60_11240 [Bacteroides fragilis]|nr:hypothetical protein NXW60_11240 [Bacteroides fragilis]
MPRKKPRWAMNGNHRRTLHSTKNNHEPWFFSFQDVESARKVLPENSKYWLSLNGDWKFNWAPDPDSRPKDFYQTTFDVSGWDNIPVPSSWNIYGIQKDGSLEIRSTYLCEPTCHFHAQSESRRLARRCDAYSSH